mmetsp:Transcript_119870/g.382661  ORF Transcript_119870/g.382661 Transcript_119870/m.382661 type:complete len:256 (+) Transcript_119870:83-850(+)
MAAAMAPMPGGGQPMHNARVEYQRADPRSLTMGLDIDGDGRMDQLMHGPLGIDVDNDGIIDVVITPEQLRAFLIEQGLPPDKLPANMAVRPLSPSRLLARESPLVMPRNAPPHVFDRTYAAPQPLPNAHASVRYAPWPPPAHLQSYMLGRTPLATHHCLVPTAAPYVPHNVPMTHRPPEIPPASPKQQPVPHQHHGKMPKQVHLPVKITMRKVSRAQHDGRFPYHDPMPEVGCHFVGHLLPATSDNLWLETDFDD